MAEQRRPSSEHPSLVCYISCSDHPEDIQLRREWEKQCSILVHQQVLTLRSKDQLQPGANVGRESDDQLHSAKAIVLCLSPDYFTELRCQHEVDAALSQAQSGQSQVFLLFLRPINWQDDQRLLSLPCFPDPTLPISGWKDRDLALRLSVRRLCRALHLHIGEIPRPDPFQARELPAGFIPRPEIFEALKQILLHNRGSQTAPTAALTTALRGAGGFGKTTLALALCHDSDVWEAFSDGILWITLTETPPNQLDLLHSVLRTLDAAFQERPLPRLLDEAKVALSRVLNERNCLLVLDDVWQPDPIEPLLEGGSRCTRLITTRDDRVLPDTAQRFFVDSMQEEQAVALLARQLPVQIQQETYQIRLTTLAQHLGRWPLLLNLVNRFLVQCIREHQDLASALTDAEQAQQEDGLVGFDVHDSEGRQKAVERNLALSLRQLANATPPAWQAVERYQELVIFPEDRDIPLSIVETLWQASGGLSARKVRELCRLLHQLSLLIAYDLSTGTIRLHDVLHKYLIQRAGARLPELHALLLNASRPASPLRGWIDLPQDNHYLWRFLIWHLCVARRSEEVYTLLTDLRFLARKTLFTGVVALEDDLQQVLDLSAAPVLPSSHRLSSLEEIHTKVVLISHLLRQATSLSETGGLLLSHLGTLPACSGQEETLAHDLPCPWLTAWHPLPTNASSSLRRTLQGHTSPVSSCAFSPDGRFILSCSHDNTLKLWDASTGREIRSLQGHSQGVTGCAFSPDGRFILSASRDNTLKLWDASTGHEIRSLQGHASSVSSCAFSPDGRFILSASRDNTLKLWNASTGRKIRSLQGHAYGVTGCAFSPDGRFILSCSSDRTLKLWDVSLGREIHSLQGHNASVEGCAFSPDGCFILSCSYDNTLKLWDASTGHEIHSLQGHTSSVEGCAFSPDGCFILSASRDGTLKLWDASTGREIRSLQGHILGVKGCAFSPNGRFILSCSYDNTLKLWNPSTDREIRTLLGHNSSVECCAFSPDGRFLLSCSYDTLKLWDTSTGREIRSLHGHTNWVSECAFSPDGHFILSASGDNALKLWDASTGREIRSLQGHTSSVYGCAFSPDGHFILSASGDNTLKLWDASTGSEIRSLQGHASSVYDCAFSPDGHFILSCSHDNTLKLWDASTGREIRSFQGHTSSVESCAFSPDGCFILSCSSDNTLKLWDASTGREIRSFQGHILSMSGSAFSPDGFFILSASGDNILKLWDMRDGTCILTFPVDGPLRGCAFHPDGKHVVAYGAQGMYFLRLIL